MQGREWETRRPHKPEVGVRIPSLLPDKLPCYICRKDKKVLDHHFDWRHGELSPETCPLCYRCHYTLHFLDLTWFDKENLERAVEVFNKRQEIWNNVVEPGAGFVKGAWGSKHQLVTVEEVLANQRLGTLLGKKKKPTGIMAQDQITGFSGGWATYRITNGIYCVYCTATRLYGNDPLENWGRVWPKYKGIIGVCPECLVTSGLQRWLVPEPTKKGVPVAG